MEVCEWGSDVWVLVGVCRSGEEDRGGEGVREEKRVEEEGCRGGRRRVGEEIGGWGGGEDGGGEESGGEERRVEEKRGGWRGGVFPSRPW